MYQSIPSVDATEPDPVPVDVFVAGPVFMEMVFSGLPQAPVLGTETWAAAMGTCPGGVANMAVAMSRLGLHVALATAFGDDAYGDFCRETLELGEGIDVSLSVRMAGRHTPVTVSLAYGGDRTMISHGHINEHPEVINVPAARAVFAPLSPGHEPAWLPKAKQAGSRVVVNSGWDDTGLWDLSSLEALPLADVVVANLTEAQHWTGQRNPRAAAEALGEHVPLAVVTLGADGAIAAGNSVGDAILVTGVPVHAVDTTGAGDVFLSGLMAGLAASCSPRETLVLGCVAAAMSTERIGSSLSAPCSDEIGWWYRSQSATATEEFRATYGFLDSLFPRNPWPRHPRRTVPTVGFRP